MDKQTAIAKKEAADIADIDKMFETKTFLGDIAISKADCKKLSGLAKEGIKSRATIADLKESNKNLKTEVGGLQKRLDGYEGKITDRLQYYKALERAPRRLAAAVADIMR